MSFDLPTTIRDRATRDRAVRHLKAARVRLPTFAELADPLGRGLRASPTVDPDIPDPANLLRVHWYNDGARRGLVPVPAYIEFPSSFTGVPARIALALGERFPMIGAHKVLPAYACLVARIVTGRFDPVAHKAVWPSTGNYCRGGVAISRILGCRGIAVLPEGMSAERFEWLGQWVASSEDIIRTPGTESNVKEIYDACAALARNPANVIVNQFSEFANYVSHYHCTGRALEHVYQAMAGSDRAARLAAFTSSTGSAGTIAAGDYLKERHGARIVAVEPVECPTMLYNGYGAHNIQGIGDKHIPLIQNVMNSDFVVAVSDQATDSLNVLFNTDQGRRHLISSLKLDPAFVESLGSLGVSSICNLLAAIKTAKRLDLGPHDIVLSVATDGATLYRSEASKTLAARYGAGFGAAEAAAIHARHLAGLDGDHVLELGHRDRRRIFNLGYFTWVEQQGVALGDFDQRKDQSFWRDLRSLAPAWDALIEEFNRDTGQVNA